MNAHGSRRPGRQQRLQEIVRLLRSGVGRVEDLAAAVRVSESTIRRDLASLEEDGQIARTYGGALPSGVFHEARLRERMSIEMDAKASIGATAAAWVQDGSTVFVDAGSTCAQLVEHLRDRRELTVLTRGLEIAIALADSSVRVIVVGGEVSPASHGLTGAMTHFVLDRFSVDIAFLGCDAVHPHRGVGEPTIEEAATKEAAARSARRTVVLAHEAKLTTSGVPAWAPLPTGWILVTDAGPEHLGVYHDAGVDVVSVTSART
ncbi:MAG TPA: DeoR/GlpR transcriptional regulator [Intrasporangiaceae bacterium]|nr:DeoR/GlpR transcriptional regulator [Intrasporangiaceae bacterium]